jgi:DNA-binding beta-propeller fold protein YncE
VYVEAVFGGEGTRLGQFVRPRGLGVGPGGTVYVADSGNHRIQAFHPSDGSWSEMGTFGWRLGEFDTPVAVAASLWRPPVLFVAEAGNRRVQVWDLVNGRHSIALGEVAGTALDPAALALGRRGELFVADRLGGRVVKVGARGGVEWVYGDAASDEPLHGPHGIAADGAGGLLVSETEAGGVARLDFAGNRVAAWSPAGGMTAPTAVAADSYGRWYICDRGRVFVLAPDGALLTYFGDGVLREPAGVAVAQTAHVYVSDSATHAVVRFRIVERQEARPPGGSP